MSRSPFPKAYADFVARLRVPVGFLLVAAFAWFAAPSAQSIFLGGITALFGLLLRGWAAGHLRKDKELTKSGPYAFVRNPLYIGSFIIAMGMAIAAQQLLLGVLFAVVFLLIYLPAITLEEQHLRDLFPDYDGYARRVPWLFPYKHPISRSGSFSFKQYIHNREYEAAIGFLAGIAILVAKLVYTG